MRPADAVRQTLLQAEFGRQHPHTETYYTAALPKGDGAPQESLGDDHRTMNLPARPVLHPTSASTHRVGLFGIWRSEIG